MIHPLKRAPLPKGFLARPFAHRGLHDRAQGRAENSRAACAAAIEAGYAIEIDVQMSLDGEAMVFHDYRLQRLTPERGVVRKLTAAELGAIELKGGGETIPTLLEILKLVAGRVPLLIEIKDQDGAFGPNVGPLEQRVADLLATYVGPVAVMSFNPHSVRFLGEIAPDVPRGLVSFDWPREEAPTLTYAQRVALADLIEFEQLGCAFVSYGAEAFPAKGPTRVRVQGFPVLTWTVQSALEEARTRPHADQITFEGYLPGRR